jgi:hypothetical protein
MVNLKSAYAMGDRVTIKEISWPAKVVEIRFEGLNTWYKVQYWCESKNLTTDCDEEELCLS